MTKETNNPLNPQCRYHVHFMVRQAYETTVAASSEQAARAKVSDLWDYFAEDAVTLIRTDHGDFRVELHQCDLIVESRREPSTSANVPPDPEGMNNERADWASGALRHFQFETGTDYEDSLGDLLCDLMHWADRANFDFDAALTRARGHYEAETAGAGETGD